MENKNDDYRNIRMAGRTYEEFKVEVAALLPKTSRRECADCLYGWATRWTPAQVAKNIMGTTARLMSGTQAAKLR